MNDAERLEKIRVRLEEIMDEGDDIEENIEKIAEWYVAPVFRGALLKEQNKVKMAIEALVSLSRRGETDDEIVIIFHDSNDPDFMFHYESEVSKDGRKCPICTTLKILQDD